MRLMSLTVLSDTVVMSAMTSFGHTMPAPYSEPSLPLRSSRTSRHAASVFSCGSIGSLSLTLRSSAFRRADFKSPSKYVTGTGRFHLTE
jgi:hypothetical protein